MQEQVWREKIRNYISENMNVFDDEVELQDDDNIFTKGFVSSIFAMRLLNFLENEFEAVVSDDDIVLVNFSSVDAMVDLMKKIKGAA